MKSTLNLGPEVFEFFWWMMLVVAVGLLVSYLEDK